MRRFALIAVVLSSLAFGGIPAFGQQTVDTRLLSLQDLIDYSEEFNTYRYDVGEFRLGEDYHSQIPVEEKQIIWALGGFVNSIDTPLEVALLSLCTGGMEMRPAEAEKLLPKSKMKQNELKLGAAVYQEMLVLGFLGDKAAVGRHEAVLKWIVGHGNVTRAEIEAFYRNGIQDLVSRVVDENCKGQKTPDRMAGFREMLIKFFTAPAQPAYAAILAEYRLYMDALVQIGQINDGLYVSVAMLDSGKKNGWSNELIMETQSDIDEYKKQLKEKETSWGQDNLFSEILSSLSEDLFAKLQKDTK